MKKGLLFFLSFLIFCLRADAQTAGTPDSTFNETGLLNYQVAGDQATGFYKVRAVPNGQILTFGVTFDPNLGYRGVVNRFNSDGSPDLSFGTDGIVLLADVYGSASDGYVLADGRIIVLIDNFFGNIGLARLLPNGAIDLTFGAAGYVDYQPGFYSNGVNGFKVQSDGKLLVLGTNTNFNTGYEESFITRFSSNGVLDNTFGDNGLVKLKSVTGDTALTCQVIELQADGKILVAGKWGNDYYSHEWYMARLMPDGSMDTGFGTNGAVLKNIGSNQTEGAYDIIPLPDGKTLIGGFAEKQPGFHFTVLRIKPNGDLDNTFGLGGKAQTNMNCCQSVIFSMARQADGKIVACGYAQDPDGHLLYSIARFKANGLLDATFGDAGRLMLNFKQTPTDSIDQRATAVSIQSDQKILVAGWTGYNNYLNSGILMRFNPGAVVGTETPEEDFSDLQDVRLSPNPVKGAEIHLVYTLKQTTIVGISLYDLLGRKIGDLAQAQEKPEGDQEDILTLPDGLAPGSYLIKLETPLGCRSTQLLKSE